MLALPTRSTVPGKRYEDMYVASLWALGEQGAVYDPSDLSTLFQDSAGTTPVTAMEQPVGLMLDKSGRGNHAFQATTTKRGVVSRRVNGFTATEDISQAAWLKRQATVSGVDKIQEDSSTNLHYVRQDVPVFAGVYTLSFEAKQSERTIAWASLDGSSNTLWFDLANGVSGGIGAGSSKITSIGDGWYKCEYIITKTAGTAPCFVGCSNSTTITNYPGVTGNGIFLRKLAIAEQGTAYQRVNTATDYDADPNKFPTYIRFDGVDDAYQTNSIDFTGTDKMTVWAGYAKLNDGPTSVFLETGANYTGGGGIGIFSSDGSSTNSTIAHSDIGGNKTATFVSAATEVGVVTVRYDLQAGAWTSARKNSGAWSFAFTASGGGMLGNRPLYIGARAGASLFFNGRLYSLIVRGAATPLAQIEAVENIIKKNMRLP